MYPLIGNTKADFSDEDYFIVTRCHEIACPHRMDARIKRETFALELNRVIRGTHDVIQGLYNANGK
jgi:hypothetical protein